VTIPELSCLYPKNQIMPRQIFIFVFLLLAAPALFSQQITQNIKGQVMDDQSKVPLIGVTVVIVGSNPLKGTVTDTDGRFRIDNVAVGRYDIQVSSIGYKPFTAKEIVVSSGKEAVLDIELTESVEMLDQVINALGYKEFQEYEYNALTDKIEKKYDMLIIPNISYKIEF
jgi:hypothetical protein